jgi:flagellin-like hook-associated protein FlgL
MTATYLPFININNRETYQLNRSMKRIASNTRFVSPGDAPAELAIAERLELQIRNSQAAADVTQNGINMLQSIDAWQQNALDMLARMSELAIASCDSSKSDADRVNMEAEFRQLKQEIAKISEDSKFNGLMINSKTAVATYDTVDKRLIITQGDGSDARSVDINLRDGNSSQNSIPYCFESSAGVPGDFLLVNGGKDLLYMAQSDDATNSIDQYKTIMKLNIETNTLTMLTPNDPSGTAAPAGTQTLQSTFAIDDSGEIWVTYAADTDSDGTNDGFRIARLEVASMTLDHGDTTNSKWTAAPNTTDVGYIQTCASCPRVSVHEGRIYYIEEDASNKLNLISQNLNSASDRQVLVADLYSNYSFEEGYKYSFSPDGTYLAWTTSSAVATANTHTATDGILNLLDAATGKRVSQSMGTSASTVTSLSFDRNNRLYFTDTGDHNNKNAVRRVDIGLDSDGETPIYARETVIRNGVKGHFGMPDATTAASLSYGLSVAGDSPAVEYSFQVGPDAGMKINVNSADMRAANLGISKLSVLKQDKAEKAIKAIDVASQKISKARAEVGAQVKRLQYTLAANENYISNISATKSSIVDTDMAEETAKMTQYQLRQIASTSMLSNFNQQRMAQIQTLLR